VCHCVHRAKGKKGQNLYITCTQKLQEIKTVMLLIFFLGLIATITSVCDGYRVGIPEVKHFDWSEVGVTVLTRFLKQAAFKTAPCVYITFVVPLTYS
jgi:hypothetical protein